jgi:hypothetical protein
MIMASNWIGDCLAEIVENFWVLWVAVGVFFETEDPVTSATW